MAARGRTKRRGGRLVGTEEKARVSEAEEIGTEERRGSFESLLAENRGASGLEQTAAGRVTHPVSAYGWFKLRGTEIEVAKWCRFMHR
jgi:hypothetical protein